MTSHAEWDGRTTATEVAAAFADEIKGRNVVITGVSPDGIGFATALAVASQGPSHLILASRTHAKMDSVIAAIAARHPSTKATAVLLDLGSVASVREAAAVIEALVRGDGLDVLINNAGVSQSARSLIAAPDGTQLERHLLVNHLGPFLLTGLLTPALQRAAARPGAAQGAARVVNVSSHGHWLSPVRFSDYAFARPLFDDAVPAAERPSARAPESMLRGTGPDGFPGFVAYGQSKCANVLHAAELARRLRGGGGGGVAAFSVHPGEIATDLSRGLDAESRERMLQVVAPNAWKTLDQGAATTLVAAFDPALAAVDVAGGGATGYLADCQLREDLVAGHAKNAGAAKRLWEESERMLQIPPFSSSRL